MNADQDFKEWFDERMKEPEFAAQWKKMKDNMFKSIVARNVKHGADDLLAGSPELDNVKNG